MAASFAQPISGFVESENEEVLVLGFEARVSTQDGTRYPDAFLLTIDETGHLRWRYQSEVTVRLHLDPEYQDWIDTPIPGAKPRSGEGEDEE